MTTTTAKIQIGTAAVALAAAATLAPVVAQAAPTAPLAPSLTSFSKALGSAAGAAVCDPTEGADCTLVSSVAGNAQASQIGDWIQPIFQNQLWWFGKPNPNPPAQTVVYTFEILSLIPDWMQTLRNIVSAIDYEGCILGATMTIGPYGTVTGSYSRGCA